MEMPSIGKTGTSKQKARYTNGMIKVTAIEYRLEDFVAVEPILQKLFEESPVFEKTPDWKSKVTILNLGCGNSVIAEDLYDKGFTNVFNMDISETVIT